MFREIWDVAQEKLLTRRTKFTEIYLTVLSGNQIMYALIFEGKHLNISIEARIDITVKPNGSTSDHLY